jgi:CBS domain-containing protein
MVKVKEIMSTDVATVPPDMSVRELARFLDERGIGGAPVCDVSGKVLGVVTVSDLVRLAAEQQDPPDGLGEGTVEYPPEEVEDEGEEASWYYFMAGEAPELYGRVTTGALEEAFDQFTVRDIMTRAVFSVRPESTLEQLARFLLRARIHRALVMDRGKLVGIVTTFDVLRAVAGEVGSPATA